MVYEAAVNELYTVRPLLPSFSFSLLHLSPPLGGLETQTSSILPRKTAEPSQSGSNCCPHCRPTKACCHYCSWYILGGGNGKERVNMGERREVIECILSISCTYIAKYRHPHAKDTPVYIAPVLSPSFPSFFSCSPSHFSFQSPEEGVKRYKPQAEKKQEKNLPPGWFEEEDDKQKKKKKKSKKKKTDTTNADGTATPEQVRLIVDFCL
jgi:hypothetical protein